MKPFKYAFKFRDKQGWHTGEAENIEDLRKQIHAITRQGGEVPEGDVRVIDSEVKK